MFFWYIGVSVLAVVLVFQSVGVDYRLIAVGALLPNAVNFLFGHRAFGSTLAFPVIVLLVVMISTIGKPRLMRRRWLCLPIGIFSGLVLSGAFTNGAQFWWPLSGIGFGSSAVFPSGVVLIVEEIIGIVACWWLVGRYDLWQPGPRRAFLRTGRLELSEN